MENLGKWLDVTDQQLDIIQTIHGLELRGEKTNPKTVTLQYRKDHGKGIEVSNLFHVLRELLKRNIIKKEPGSSYVLDLDGIDQELDNYGKELNVELASYNTAKKNVETYFEKIVKKEQPFVQYLEVDKFFEDLSRAVSKAQRHYMVAPFPKLFYPDLLRKKLDRADYVGGIRERAFHRRDMELNIITDFNLEFAFRDFESFFSSQKEGLKSLISTINQIGYLVDKYENFKLYYTPKIVGMDMVLPLRDDPRELYLYMRGEKEEIIGGIKIESSESAKRALDSFQEVHKQYVLLKGSKAKRVLANVKKDIKSRFK